MLGDSLGREASAWVILLIFTLKMCNTGFQSFQHFLACYTKRYENRKKTISSIDNSECPPFKSPGNATSSFLLKVGGAPTTFKGKALGTRLLEMATKSRKGRCKCYLQDNDKLNIIAYL